MALCLATLFAYAHGQAPSGEIMRWIVGFGAGGGTDAIARIIAEPMSRRLGLTIVIENRPGANGLLAMDELCRTRPDGKTLLVSATGSLVMLPHIQKVPFDIGKDVSYIGMVSRYPLVAVVPASLPVRSLGEFIAYARREPNKLSYSSPGIGSSPHFAAEILKQETGIDLVHIPFKSDAAALPDLLEGRIALHMMNVQIAMPMIRSGKLVALAVTGATRAPELPQVPTAIEAGYPRLTISPWVALIGPAGMSTEKVRALNGALNQTLADPAVRQRLSDLGYEVMHSDPAGASQLIEEESERYRRIALNAGIKAE